MMGHWLKARRHPALGLTAGEAPPTGWRARRLARHLRSCDTCQAAYTHHVMLERVLTQGRPDVPSATERTLLRKLHLEAALRASRGREPSLWAAFGRKTSMQSRRPPARSTRLLWVLGPALAVGLVLLLRLGSRPLPPDAQDVWQARGPEAMAWQLRVFCATEDGALHPLEVRNASCPRSGTLAFAASSRSGEGQVAIRVEAAGRSLEPEAQSGDLPVSAVFGQEQALSFTYALAGVASDEVVVRAAFTAGGRPAAIVERRIRVTPSSETP